MRIIFGLCLGITLMLLILLVDWREKWDNNPGQDYINRFFDSKENSATRTGPELPVEQPLDSLFMADEFFPDLPMSSIDDSVMPFDSSLLPQKPQATKQPKPDQSSSPRRVSPNRSYREMDDAEYRHRSRKLQQQIRLHYAKITQKDSVEQNQGRAQK